MPTHFESTISKNYARLWKLSFKSETLPPCVYDTIDFLKKNLFYLRIIGVVVMLQLLQINYNVYIFNVKPQKW